MIGYENITLRIHQQSLLHEANLHVKSGDKVVIRGTSGCGKSSLLKCAVGGIPLKAGMVQVDGIELMAGTVADIRSRIAFIGQEPVLGADQVLEAIMLPFHFKAHAHNKPERKQILQVLDRLQLAGAILDKPCKHISGGEKQRIVILRAILLKKTIFLADEVTSALDPESKVCVMNELFRPEMTLLSVSHDPDWIKGCERLVEVKGTQLVEAP
jgi:putative ABC transport system ATP-binding protein